MNDFINFKTFSSAFITLFTVATFDSIHLTMQSFTHGKSAWNDCLETPIYQDYDNNGFRTVGYSSQAESFAFFISFIFLVNLIFLELIIAIILDGYKKI
jgi:hypothetical protein